MVITWDAWKNRKNMIKHGISFEEASNVFHDEDIREYHDRYHSIFEDRFVAVGNAQDRILSVVFTEPDGDTVRIISARKANKQEKEEYYGNRSIYPRDSSKNH
jgi:uncharacterized DUF497 family protein